AVSAYSHDHHGRSVGRGTAGPGQRHWRRAAPPAGHYHGWRTRFQPTPHPVYDPGHLPGLCWPGNAVEPAQERPCHGAYVAGGGGMNISALFIHRPAGTTLLTIALALAGLIAYHFLPVAPLPQVEFPTIQVQAQLPGASPEIMASAVATPLERQFGRIAGLNEMTSTSYLGSTNIALQFDLSRD